MGDLFEDDFGVMFGALAGVSLDMLLGMCGGMLFFVWIVVGCVGCLSSHVVWEVFGNTFDDSGCGLYQPLVWGLLGPHTCTMKEKVKKSQVGRMSLD